MSQWSQFSIISGSEFDKEVTRSYIKLDFGTLNKARHHMTLFNMTLFDMTLWYNRTIHRILWYMTLNMASYTIWSRGGQFFIYN